jgi:cytochrome c
MEQESDPAILQLSLIAYHSAPGVGGAPAIGDAAAWARGSSRVTEALKDHAFYGFWGDAGFMPAKGDRVDLSDEEIVSAVQYMVEQVQ